MFGVYRVFLALAVVVHHLLTVPMSGQYAVQGFFILSGYLMTYVMANTYGYSLNGLKSFAVNRFLRLYPCYWIILCLSLAIILYWGEDQARVYRDIFFIPKNPLEWIQNITLIFANLFPTKEFPRLSPPTWTLTIELLFYLVIALGLSRKRSLALSWLVASVFYMAMTHFWGLGYGYRYTNIIAGSLPFALGSCICLFREQLCLLCRAISKPLPIIVLFFLFVINVFFAAINKKIGGQEVWFYLSFYLNYVINALLVLSLINGRLPWISKKLDQKIGDYSYPIYLFHWQAGFLASMIIWGEPTRGRNFKSFVSWILAVFVCFFISWVIIKFIDQPIQKLREKVKQKHGCL